MKDDSSKNIEMTTIQSSHPDVKFGWPADKYDKWMEGVNRRKRLQPFEERRIGWINTLPGYRVLCCGNSAMDLSIIFSFMLLFYLLNAVFIWCLYLLSELNVIIVPHVFGLIGFAVVGGLVIVLHIKGKEMDWEHLEQRAGEVV